jgi:hypothetical protein
MGKKDPRVDAYIKKAAPFAQPILSEFGNRARRLSRGQGDDQGSFPHFDYKGVMCSMAAFQGAPAFGFWKGSLVIGGRGRKTRWALRPHHEAIRSAVEGHARGLRQEGGGAERPGCKVARAKRAPKPVKVPADLSAALEKRAKARAGFAALSPSHQRDTSRITEARPLIRARGSRRRSSGWPREVAELEVRETIGIRD